MGSLNDLYFTPSNGNARAADADTLNEAFERLLSVAWGQATALRREAE